MKLYDVPRDTYVRVSQKQGDSLSKYQHGDQIDLEDMIEEAEVKVPPGAPVISNSELLFFSHIDGMYSYCHKVDPDTLQIGEVCHIAAWTEVDPVDLIELFTFDQIREKIGRSGYGKDGKGEYRSASLKDMSDAWVKASIDFVNEYHPHLKYYKMELEYRKNNGIEIPDKDA
jgi:MFS superfamily sulfate permease-like transporter